MGSGLAPDAAASDTTHKLWGINFAYPLRLQITLSVHDWGQTPIRARDRSADRAGALLADGYCMRMAHACHSQDNTGPRFESVCRTCGWCHALPNARAHLASAAIALSFSVYHAPALSESQSQPAAAPSRLHASRAPPRNAIAIEAI